jgi:hypothetical protein
MAMDIAIEAGLGDDTLTRGGVRIFLQKAASALLADAVTDCADDRGFVISGMPKSSCC